MTFNPATFRPLKHKLLVAVSRIAPSIAWFPGFVEPPPHYHPLEMPAFVRKRLVDFLECRYPVPPKYLQSILTAAEAGEARTLYRSLLEEGVEPGEAIVQLGLVSRSKGYNLPTFALARLLRAGCDCLSVAVVPSVTIKELEDGPTLFYIVSSAGDPLGTPDDLRVIRCNEALGIAERVAVDARAADAARLAAFRSRQARLLCAV